MCYNEAAHFGTLCVDVQVVEFINIIDQLAIWRCIFNFSQTIFAIALQLSTFEHLYHELNHLQRFQSLKMLLKPLN